MKRIISVAMAVCMMLAFCAVANAKEPAVVRISTEKGSGTYFVNQESGGRTEVQAENAILANVEIDNCAEADVCSGIIRMTYDVDKLSVKGFKGINVGAWEVNSSDAGVLRMAFSNSDAITDGIIFSAAFEPKDDAADAEFTFTVEVDELLTGDILHGDVPCEYYIATEKAVYSESSALLMGDANDDGSVNTADAAYVLKYSADMVDLTDKQYSQANVNRDDNVNTADATLILKYAADMIDGF